MKRQIVLDTETTGLDPEQGHRIIEIGCVEIINRKITGNNYHQYINPERIVGNDAIAVHGIRNEFLKDKPVFAKISADFLRYIKDADLIIHNAPFDIGFFEYEFQLLREKQQFSEAVNTVIDTLPLARKMHPGQRNSLDALCKRYNVDNSGRDYHGALLDSLLLAEVYLRMTGGQGSLFAEDDYAEQQTSNKKKGRKTFVKKSLPVIYADENDLAAHNKYLEKIKKKSGKCIWENN